MAALCVYTLRKIKMLCMQSDDVVRDTTQYSEELKYLKVPYSSKKLLGKVPATIFLV